jgi:signal transduction histidine kinase
MLRISLTARAFLLSFLPICVVLGASFLALSTAVHQTVRGELKASLEASDRLLNRVSADYDVRTNALLTKLTDSAGLKAAVGLLAETTADPSVEREVRRTIENQLAELQRSSIYDLVAVSDLHGRTIAVLSRTPMDDPEKFPAVPATLGLAELGDAIYQLKSVPIEIGDETAAILTLGSRFETSRLPLAAQAALLRQNRIVQSSFPAEFNSIIETQIAKRCSAAPSGCEVSIHGETFVVSQLDQAQLGHDYRLLAFRSLDAQLRSFHNSFLRILFEVGAGGLLLALVCTLITSRSVSQPIRELVAQLSRSELDGGLPQDLTVRHGVQELDSLVRAFNGLAAAERRSRGEIEEAKKAAETANRLKTEFLTNISHELRTPINGVLGMTELLLDTTLNQEQRDYASIVRDSAQSLTGVIDDILDFSRLEAGKLALEKGTFDLQALIQEATKQAQSQAAMKGLTLDIISLQHLPRFVVGDGTRIRQVLRILLDNAVKFTETGSIRVIAECLDDCERDATVKVSIEDTGIGIAPEMFGFIFEKFTQADGSLTRRHGGTGVGLALAQEAVDLLGGQIGVHSEIGRGSTFWFSVKFEKAQASQENNALAAAIRS